VISSLVIQLKLGNSKKIFERLTVPSLLHQWVATLTGGLKTKAEYSLLLFMGSLATRPGPWEFLMGLMVGMLSSISSILNEPSLSVCKIISSFIETLN
jgi:hypothetical protein